jgi:hypothetical protein
LFHGFFTISSAFVTPIFYFFKRPKKGFSRSAIEQLPQEIEDAGGTLPCRESPCNPYAATGPLGGGIADSHVFFTMRKIFFHDGFLRSLRISRSLTMSNFALRAIGERQDEFD